MKAGFDCVGVGCGALIVNDRNDTLLLKRTDKTRNQAGFWAKPGGKVEFTIGTDGSITTSGFPEKPLVEQLAHRCRGA
jgi:ADP-ribose pyrophosphatase YjhB (NUDIX family)